MGSEHLVEKLLLVLPLWHSVISKSLQHTLKDRMSPESYYCLQILRQNGPLSMSELARRLRISPQQATQTVERLHRHEMVLRQSDGTDRRCVRIHLTPQAGAYLEELAELNKAALRDLDARLGEENARELDAALDTLLRLLPELAET